MRKVTLERAIMLVVVAYVVYMAFFGVHSVFADGFIH
jgi:hypothetical protein